LIIYRLSSNEDGGALYEMKFKANIHWARENVDGGATCRINFL